jgi:hypothetical protein
VPLSLQRQRWPAVDLNREYREWEAVVHLISAFLMDLQINPSADHTPGARQFGREPPRVRRYWHLPRPLQAHRATSYFQRALQRD